MKKLALLAAALLVFLSFSSVEAANRYVDGNLSSTCSGSVYSIANRNCSGSDGAGYKTGQECADAANAGDTCFVRQGTYSYSLHTNWITSVRSGSTGNRITFKGYVGDSKPIISGPIDTLDLVGDTFAFYIYTHNWITIDGFDMVGGSVGIQTYGGTDNIEALNNTVSFTLATGISFYGGSTNGLIQNNIVHDTNRENWPRGAGTLCASPPCNWGAGITAGSGSTGVSIIGNTSYWNHGEGISCHNGSNNCIIRNNISVDNWSVNIYADGSANVLIEKNFAGVSTDARNWTPGGCCGQIADGIATATEVGGSGYTTNGLIIRNNVVANAKSCFLAWQSVAQAITNITVVNNTCVHNDHEIVLNNSAGQSALLIQNNITANHTNNASGATAFANPAPTSSTFSYNIYNGSVNSFQWGGSVTTYPSWASSAGEANSPGFVDPLLVNQSAVPPRFWNDPGGLGNGSALQTLAQIVAAYALTQNSPAKDAGITISGASPDILGVTRPVGSVYDIGALEFQGATVPNTPIKPRSTVKP